MKPAGGQTALSSSGRKVVRAERERESSEGQSRGMPRRDARFARTLLGEEAERQVCWPTVTAAWARGRQRADQDCGQEPGGRGGVSCW